MVKLSITEKDSQDPMKVAFHLGLLLTEKANISKDRNQFGRFVKEVFVKVAEGMMKHPRYRKEVTYLYSGVLSIFKDGPFEKVTPERSYSYFKTPLYIPVADPTFTSPGNIELVQVDDEDEWI